MASSNSLTRLAEITECPICITQLEDPKGLPCFHTFCLKCLQQYVDGARDGEMIGCPLCREEFLREFSKN